MTQAWGWCDQLATPVWGCLYWEDTGQCFQCTSLFNYCTSHSTKSIIHSWIDWSQKQTMQLTFLPLVTPVYRKICFSSQSWAELLVVKVSIYISLLYVAHTVHCGLQVWAGRSLWKWCHHIMSLQHRYSYVNGFRLWLADMPHIGPWLGRSEGRMLAIWLGNGQFSLPIWDVGSRPRLSCCDLTLLCLFLYLCEDM